MIKDHNTLEGLKKEWLGVELLRDKLKRSAYASTGVVGGTFPFTLANAAHNLPFIHACSVLNEVLVVLAKEGHFKCKSIFLGALLESSENSLTWMDYETIVAAAQRRNGVAHRADLLERGECWQYVDAIKKELGSWNII